MLKNAAAKGEIVDDEAVACTTWTAWRKKVDLWRVQQNKVMPHLWTQTSSSKETDFAANLATQSGNQSDDDDDDDDQYIDEVPSSSTTAKNTVSNEILGLPSDLNAAERKEFEVEVLAEYELRLRIGQAFDLLDDVRHAVKHLAAYIEDKRHTGHTTKDNMRSNNISKFSRAHCQRVAKRYNYVFDRLVALRTHPPGRCDPDYHLQRINLDKDLTIVNLKVAREKTDSQREGSWIWWAFEDAMESTPASAAGKRKKGGKQAETQPKDPEDNPSSWCTYTVAIPLHPH